MSQVGDAGASLSVSIERNSDAIHTLARAHHHTGLMWQSLLAALGGSMHSNVEIALASVSEATNLQHEVHIALATAQTLLQEYLNLLGLEAGTHHPGSDPQTPFEASQARVPQGLSAEIFEMASRELIDGTAHLTGVIVVQGSRAIGTARPSSDIDFAVLVDQTEFEEVMRRRFGTPNRGSAKERKMEHAFRTGKIQAGEAGLGALRRRLQATLGIDVDLSIVRRGGPFDTPPFIEVSHGG